MQGFGFLIDKITLPNCNIQQSRIEAGKLLKVFRLWKGLYLMLFRLLLVVIHAMSCSDFYFCKSI